MERAKPGSVLKSKRNRLTPARRASEISPKRGKTRPIGPPCGTKMLRHGIPSAEWTLPMVLDGKDPLPA
jgi:hypothetical protein